MSVELEVEVEVGEEVWEEVEAVGQFLCQMPVEIV